MYTLQHKVDLFAKLGRVWSSSEGRTVHIKTRSDLHLEGNLARCGQDLLYELKYSHSTRKEDILIHYVLQSINGGPGRFHQGG